MRNLTFIFNCTKRYVAPSSLRNDYFSHVQHHSDLIIEVLAHCNIEKSSGQAIISIVTWCPPFLFISLPPSNLSPSPLSHPLSYSSLSIFPPCPPLTVSLFVHLSISLYCICTYLSLRSTFKMLSKCRQSDLFCIILQCFIVISSPRTHYHLPQKFFFAYKVLEPLTDKIRIFRRSNL